jgi:DnaJ-class molecular chaperone
MRKHLKTLGLQEGATNEEIQAAYERLSNDLDPKNNDNEAFFKEEFKST